MPNRSHRWQTCSISIDVNRLADRLRIPFKPIIQSRHISFRVTPFVIIPKHLILNLSLDHRPLPTEQPHTGQGFVLVEHNA